MTTAADDFWAEKANDLRRDLTGKITTSIDEFVRSHSVEEISRTAGGLTSTLSANTLAAVVATLLSRPLPAVTFASPLRERIQATIQANKDSAEVAAIEVCKLLDWDLALAGNGGWDDDEVMQRELANGNNPTYRGTIF